MKDAKRCLRMFVVMLMVLLPMFFLTGCHSNVGWDRMDAPLGRQG
jgi:hypothetical protein